MGGVVRPDAGLGGEVEEPADGFVAGGDGARRRVGGGWRDFGRVEAHDFAAVVDEIDEAAGNSDGRGDAAFGPVEVGVFFALGDDELPEECAGLFVEAHEDAAVALFARVARVAVVGADVDAAAGNDRCGVGFGAELRGPLDVLAGFGVEGAGKMGLGGDHVARPSLAELRLVAGVAHERAQAERKAEGQGSGPEDFGDDGFQIGLRVRAGGLLEVVEEGLAVFAKTLLEFPGAIAVGAGPRLGAVEVAAVSAAVRVFDADELEVFLPVRPFLGERRGAKAGLDPVGGAVVGESGLFHVVNIFIAGNGAATERAVADGAQQRGVLAGFDAGFDQVTHIVRWNIS